MLGLAGVGMVGGTCISTDNICSKMLECSKNLCQQMHSSPRFFLYRKYDTYIRRFVGQHMLVTQLSAATVEFYIKRETQCLGGDTQHDTAIVGSNHDVFQQIDIRAKHLHWECMTFSHLPLVLKHMAQEVLACMMIGS